MNGCRLANTRKSVNGLKNRQAGAAFFYDDLSNLYDLVIEKRGKQDLTA